MKLLWSIGQQRGISSNGLDTVAITELADHLQIDFSWSLAAVCDLACSI